MSNLDWLGLSAATSTQLAAYQCKQAPAYPECAQKTVPAILCFCYTGSSEQSVLKMNHTLVLQIQGRFKIIILLEILQYPVKQLWMASISTCRSMKIYQLTPATNKPSTG